MFLLVRRFTLPSAVLGLSFVALVLPIVASTYFVNSTADLPDADPADGVCKTINNNCTLRAAIMQADFIATASTIILPAGTYKLTRAGYDDDAIVGDLDIKHDLTIQGVGSGATIIDGNGSVTHDRVFQILSTVQNVTLSGMAIRNGESLSSTVGVIGGGGLYIEGAGHVTLNDVILDSNTGQNGGGIYANFSSSGGSLQLDHVIVHANTVMAGGVGAGGGVYVHLPSSAGQFIVRDSQIYNNTADGTGGGLYVDGNSTVQWSIQRSQIYSNTAASGGAIGNFVPLTLSDSNLHDNHVTFDGGAMETFSPYTLSRTTLDANSAGRFGGGIFNLQTTGSAQNFANIEESTLSGNFAKYGGGIYHDGFIVPGSLITLTNSTVSGNAVGGPSPTPSPSPIPGAAGGGLYIYGGQVQLLNATIASNRVQLGLPLHPNGGIGGGLYITASAMFFAQNSVIANNARGNGIMLDTADDGFTDTALGPIAGELAFNLIRTTTNFFITGPQGGNIFGQDPLLGPLQKNGGSTQTHALMAGSPAINAANANAPARDQRNYIRPDAPDIGAFEFNGTIPTSLGNISTRGFVGTGNNVLIAGLIVTGGGSKEVILRALGPTLGQPPFNVPAALADPILELHDSTGAIITTNDNWGSAPNAAAISASGYAPPNSHESAILTNLTSGNYTAIVKGANNTTGVALVEGYDLDGSTTTSKFGNISTRGFVETGNNVMIAGVIVKGPDSQDVIIRGLGPTLTQFGVPSVLPNPFLDLRDANGNPLMTNNNWKDTQQTQIQGSGYAPPNDAESAILTTLAPGNYTAILSGVGNSTGNALVEVYSLN